MALKINSIGDNEFKNKGVSSLADRPNQASTYGVGGLSPAELKARFDQLSLVLKDKVNEIVDTLSSSNATRYIGLGSPFKYDNLFDLLSSINNGELSDSLYVTTISGDKIPLNYIVQMLQQDDAEFEERLSALEQGGGGSPGGGSVSITVDSALSETSTNPVQNKVITEAISNKQDKLQAGTGIIINGNIISSTGGGGSSSSITIDSALSTTSTNPVQNKVIAEALSNRLGKTEAEVNFLRISKAKEIYVPLSEFRKGYIDFSEHMSGNVISSTSFNAKLEELASQAKGEQDRVDIYFYQSDPSMSFKFDNNIVWQSNCNYHYVKLYDISGENATDAIVLNNISNCRFEGFSIEFMDEDEYALSISECTNIEFRDCSFINGYSSAVYISNSNSILFNDCKIHAGNYKNGTQQIACVINDSQSSENWILFENCSIRQGWENGTIPLISCENVTNALSLVTVIHCFTNYNTEITASWVRSGSGSVKVFNSTEEETPLTAGKGISLSNNQISIDLSRSDGSGLTGNDSSGTAMRLPSKGLYLLRCVPGACVIVNADSTSQLIPFYANYSTGSSGTIVTQHYLLIGENLGVQNIALENGAFKYYSTNISYTKIG